MWSDLARFLIATWVRAEARRDRDRLRDERHYALGFGELELEAEAAIETQHHLAALQRGGIEERNFPAVHRDEVTFDRSDVVDTTSEGCVRLERR